MVTNIQRAFCVVLSLIFLCVVAALPGDFFRHGEVYRSLPLYCFLEKKALQEENGRDRETEMLLQKKNAEHLGEEVAAENRREQEELLMAEAEKDAADSRDERQEETQAEKDKIVDESKSGVEEKKEKEEKEEKEEQETVALPHPQIDLSQAKLADFDYVMNHFFILDSNTETNAGQISGTRFLEEDMSIKQDSSVPQILIYHTHSQETYADYAAGNKKATVVELGNRLTALLEEKGYQVLHDTTSYDMAAGKLDRNHAYNYALDGIMGILQKYPSIQVVLDLHRDGVKESLHMVRTVNGKATAPIMFFNGMSQTPEGEIEYLKNPYKTENLAFSLQMQLLAEEEYPDLTRKIFLKGLRYNLHVRPRSALIEVGAQTNTLEEALNAMEPLADLLDQVLGGG